jgi:hypothetical protein
MTCKKPKGMVIPKIEALEQIEWAVEKLEATS